MNAYLRRIIVPIACGTGAVLASWPGGVLAQGCAMCKTALGGPEDPLAAGLNTSILFMMAMPFALVGSVGLWLFYMSRREGQREANVYVLPARQEEGQS